MIITTQDLKSYTICPMLCKFNTQPTIDPLLKALKQSLSYMYAFEMSNQKKVSATTMLKKWDQILKQEAHHFSETKLSKNAVYGWLILKKYMDKIYYEDTRTPSIVGLTHKAPFDNIYLQTTFDVVLCEPHDQVTLLEFATTKEVNNLQLQLEQDIEAKTKLYLLKKSLGDTKCRLVKYNLNKYINRTASIEATKNFMIETQDIIKGIVDNIKGDQDESKD